MRMARTEEFLARLNAVKERSIRNRETVQRLNPLIAHWIRAPWIANAAITIGYAEVSNWPISMEETSMPRVLAATAKYPNMASASVPIVRQSRDITCPTRGFNRVQLLPAERLIPSLCVPRETKMVAATTARRLMSEAIAACTNSISDWMPTYHMD
jgi:hypothetical protein